jgi:uncharacterized membrane protein YphA (DoxX/SURF4 family)
MKGFVISYIKTLLHLAVLLGLATAAATITGIINPIYYILASENTRAWFAWGLDGIMSMHVDEDMAVYYVVIVLNNYRV